MSANFQDGENFSETSVVILIPFNKAKRVPTFYLFDIQKLSLIPIESQPDRVGHFTHLMCHLAQWQCQESAQALGYDALKQGR
ncbi:MAG: hypothetical protein JMN29_16450 [gamma proteobacterium endosymbiont of Lamellibrachia anaximandri]|nr:hypothetical protein [gamma proteobacterium endosymbiont of Lamellibrachia anaximandri]